MTSILDNDELRFEVVTNAEGQHSIWPEGWQPPLGWSALGFAGKKPDCLRHIESVWDDMRPRSLVNDMNSRNA